eukprot:1871205-Pleurochrysis_carterae.AAC.2
MSVLLISHSIGTISALATWLAFMSEYGYLPILIIGPDNNGWPAQIAAQRSAASGRAPRPRGHLRGGNSAAAG